MIVVLEVPTAAMDRDGLVKILGSRDTLLYSYLLSRSPGDSYGGLQVMVVDLGTALAAWSAMAQSPFSRCQARFSVAQALEPEDPGQLPIFGPAMGAGCAARPDLRPIR